MDVLGCSHEIDYGPLVHGRLSEHEVQVVDGKECPCHLSQDCSYFLLLICENLLKIAFDFDAI